MIEALLFGIVLIGYAAGWWLFRRKIKDISLILAFSGAFLLSVTLFELLPEVFESSSGNISIWIMVGILLQIVLDFFSKGAEHGHVHLAHTKTFPIMLLISLSIHALIEGYPVADHHNMLVGVLIHKLPIAIILSFFFFQSQYSKLQTGLFMLVFACMTPIGSYLAQTSELLEGWSSQLNALAIGIFLHVSTTILFESSKDHRFNLLKLLAIIVAVVIAYLL